MTLNPICGKRESIKTIIQKDENGTIRKSERSNITEIRNMQYREINANGNMQNMINTMI